MAHDDIPADGEAGAHAPRGSLDPSGIADHAARQHGLKVSPGTVRLWVEAGRVPAVVDERGELLIDPDDVDRFFERGGTLGAHDAQGPPHGITTPGRSAGEESGGEGQN